MLLSDISVPEVYKQSADFRFFLRWFEFCLSKVQTDTENLIDLLDPLRCPTALLWMLADTCGYKYDERATVAFNRLVVLNFASLIRNRGSQVGMIYAAELNLKQLDIDKQVKGDSTADPPKPPRPELSERLEDTSIPVNTANVIVHTALGYIELIYVSEIVPTDVCTEYVRPLGMYCFANAGVQVNTKTKISVDARLTDMNDRKLATSFPPFGPTFVGHYRRSDYASIQKYVGRYNRSDYESQQAYEEAIHNLEERKRVWNRNSKYEEEPAPREYINPGYRTLYSMQLSNNEHVVKALLPSLEDPEQIFSIGYGPQSVEVVYPDDYLKHPDEPRYNLRLNRDLEGKYAPNVYTKDSAESILKPKPAVNPPMAMVGDAISVNYDNTKYTKIDTETGDITVVDVDDAD